MSSKIFKSVFFTSMLVLAVSFLMIFSILFDYFEAQIFSELKNETQYISYGIKDGAEEFLENFKAENKRITIVAPDGTVLADTKAEAEKLEDHSDREEIDEAIKNGFGKSERYSKTLTEKTLYYAKRLDDGNILRVSTTQNSVILVVLGLVQPILLIIAIALFISAFFAYKVSNSIIKSINSLDPEHPETADIYDELVPLMKKISAQNKTIKEQIKAAEKSREEFRLICENMNEGFLVIDKRGTVLSYNTAALNFLGISEPENNNILVFNRTRQFCEVIKNALLGSRAEETIKFDGKVCNLIANPVYQKDEIIGAVLVIIDITENAERERLRREFTSNVSHELKTPLTSISGFAEMMKGGGMPDETVVDFSGAIYDEAQRLITLVSDIMKISELDEAGEIVDTEKIDLYSASKAVAKRLMPIAEKQGITINVIGDSAYTTGAAKIIDEMIYNLCDNAIKYNKPNGNVDIIITSSSKKVKLTVRDTGIGIAKCEQSRVFERFYRVDKSRSKSAGGTGLGLAIVKHGAIYHNAKVSIESDVDRGASFTIEFNNAEN